MHGSTRFQLVSILHWQGNGSPWIVRAKTSDGIYVRCPNEFFNAITLPPQLEKRERTLRPSFEVGWQHRNYATTIDPKEALLIMSNGWAFSSIQPWPAF
jgi:hypothetical protein